MTKRTKTTVDEGQETAEQVQELSRKEIIAQMWNNAKSELARIEGDREGLEQFVNDKTYHIKLLAEQRDASDKAHQSALSEEEEAAGRVTRENGRLQIAISTPAENERSAILQSLVAALDVTKKGVEAAEKARDEAHEKAKLITVLQEEISEAQGRMRELDQEQREMGSLRDEQCRAYGIAIRDEIKDGIESAKERRSEALRVAALAEQEIDQLRRSISRGELDQWRDLRDQLQKSHGGSEDPGAMSPGEKIVKGYIDYLRIIAENGHAIHKRPFMEKRNFCNALDLNPSMMDWLVSPEANRQAYITDSYGQKITLSSNHKIDAAEQLLEHERRNRRSNW